MIGAGWRDRLTLPVIAAPMTAVSGPDLVSAACRQGIVGSFPTHNAPSLGVLDEWLRQIAIATAANPEAAPVAPNLVVHTSNRRRDADIDCLIEHGIELVITSVGSPAPVVPRLHSSGCSVLADVATMRHVDRAIDAGVDGLILLSAGAGGQTGSANPFAFVRAVRDRFDGLVVLAGGISDGASILAAQVLGADLVYLGTRMIATEESLASEDYRGALIDASLDDVQLTSAISGLPANVLASWLAQQSIPDGWDSAPGTGYQQGRLLLNPSVWSAGHGVGSIREVAPLEDVLTEIRHQYDAARELLLSTNSRTPN